MTTTEQLAREEMYRGSLEQPPIYEAVTRILADLPAITKNGTAPGNMGGYKFRRVEDITAALKPLFAKHGVLCVPDVLERVESQRATAKGGVMFCVDLKIEFRFIGPKGDNLATTVWGQGTDSGDKATQKAVTSAFKTMLSVVFCISDSEMDAEAHDVPETARRVPAPKDRIEACKTLILERDLTDWIKAQGYEWPWSDEECGWIELYAANQPGPNATAANRGGPGGTDPDATVLVPVVEPVMSRAESKTVDVLGDLSEFPDDPF